MKRSAAGGWNQEVTDEEGRRRFHGAFTGGFSAGYYNSVGSREGWQPATFASSRSDRASQRGSQRPEDFMDADDDPLLGRRLETSARFDTLPARAKPQQQETRSAADQPRNAFESRVLGAAAMNLLDDFVVPANESVGAKLLNQMGWKEGHGIGPCIRRKRIEDPPLAATAVVSGAGADGDPAASRQQQADPHDADEADVVYVPPRSTVDVSAFPKPKLDRYGAGFDPYVNAPEFSRYKQHQASELAQRQQKRQVVTFADAMKATSGGYETVTGFGLSALEENDDLDVYGTAPMSEFDTAIGGPTLRLTGGREVKLLESEARESVARERRPPKFGSDGRPALAGFEYAYAKEKPPKAVALCLEVPADFDPHHRFDDQDATLTSQLYQQHNFVARERRPAPVMTAKQRAALLGESEEHDDPRASASGSVFDLLGAEQKAKLLASAAQARTHRDEGGDRHSTAPPAPPRERQPLIQGVAGSQFRANITASIAKRFVSASSSDQEQSSQADAAPATGAKKSYRSESAWTPTSLLCKRFHVKCVTGASSSTKSQAEEKRDLFDKELVPHIVEFAAERRGTQGVDAAKREVTTGSSSGVAAAASSSGSSSTPRTTSRFTKRDDTKDEDELCPLPIEPKPAASLLKAIFEPSDESDVEEEDSDDDEDDDASTAGSEGNKRNAATTSSANDSAPDRVQCNIVTPRHAGHGVPERIVSSAIHDKDKAAADVSSSSSDSEDDRSSEKRGGSSVADSQRLRLAAEPARQHGGARRSSDKESERRDKRDQKGSKKRKKHKKERKHRSRSSRHEDDDSSDSSANESDDGGRKRRKERKKSHHHKRKKTSSSSRESPERSHSRKHRRH